MIVGLGNPGPDYSATRHKVGQWFVEELAKQNSASFKREAKYKTKGSKDRIEW